MWQTDYFLCVEMTTYEMTGVLFSFLCDVISFWLPVLGSRKKERIPQSDPSWRNCTCIEEKYTLYPFEFCFFSLLLTVICPLSQDFRGKIAVVMAILACSSWRFDLGTDSLREYFSLHCFHSVTSESNKGMLTVLENCNHNLVLL